MLIIIYVVISVILIAVLLGLLINCEQRKKDNFCVCQAMRRQSCPNPENLQDLYYSGKLTEFTDLAKYGSTWSSGNYGSRGY